MCFPLWQLRSSWVLTAMFMASMAMGQGKFTINGRLRVDGGGLDGCRMVVLKNGEKHRTVSTGLNRFSMELDLDASYVLSFEKQGFVTKRLSFNTQVPATASREGFSAFDFVVSLFKQYDGVNTVVFNQPVGMIRYDEVVGDFDYDTDYTKSIQSALDAAQQEVERKQREESRLAEAQAKQKQAEAREQAKAASQAAKAAAAQERAQPKRSVEVEKPTPPEPQVVRKAPPERVAKPREAASLPHASEQVEVRRGSTSHMMEEPSRVQPARMNSMEEPRPKFDPVPVGVVRHHDLIIQPNEVVTVISVEQGESVTEYRRVARKFGGVFYFKNGQSCSQFTYENEALAEN
ncbi:MAG TPA: hypothetical protein PLV70_02810 [Flavobacteriales bacterium]|nr:hypothetical protein [Flavobacteriales bacterium]HRO38452.1 hypothetical protein [Flavobacteriales bacterium]HRP80592.1 hypothetical protein [Flavobacteriales bacterium]HRQ84027.1 hypothetical protein [Flavobacteriales bacterium]